MTAFLVLAGTLTMLWMTVPELRTPLWALIGLASVGAVCCGVHVHRPAHHWPWWTLAAGLLAFTAGDTYYNVQEAYFTTANPFPSPADACYLAVYPLFAAGLFGLVRYRWAGRAVPGLLDALLVTTGLGLVVWVHLVQTLTRLEGLTWQERAIGIAYPLGDVLVLALLAPLLSPGTASGVNRAVQFLVLGTLTLLCIDIAYGIQQLAGAWQAGTLLDSGWIVFYTAWGLAALHPSMAGLSAAQSPPRSLLPPWRRLLILAAATLVSPVLLIHEEALGRVGDATALAAFSGTLFLLVILRLAVMVLAYREAVARDQALRAAASALVAAFWPHEIAQTCEAAVVGLVGGKVRHATMLLPAEDAHDLYARLASCSRNGDGVAGEGRPVPARGGAVRDETARGALPEPVGPRTLMVPTSDCGPVVAARLRGLPTALVCPMVQPDRPAGGEPPGVLVVAGHDQHLAEVRDSLEILASHAGLATERVALRREIVRKQSEAYFRTLVHNASDVILIVDDDMTVRYASPSSRAVFGSAELTGARLPDLVGSGESDRVVRTLTALRNPERQEVRDHWWVARDTRRIEVEVRCRDLRQDRTVGGLVVTLRDVTEQRQLEHDLTQRAFHDSLTGLPNRTLLLERTERALLRGRRESTVTCLLFVDLDDFKIVNDTLGHAVGDRLLCAVAERLAAVLRRTDTAARLGGDEFAVLMEDAKEPLDGELLAAQLIQTLSRPFQLADASVRVSASVGIATARDSTDTQELLALADVALYAAKAAGKRQWRRFQPQQRVRMAARHDLRARLDSAVARQEFDLRYQPVVDIAADEVVGFEALARWPGQHREPVPPTQFIPLAEETGHISALGAWVLHSAAADMAGLQHRTAGLTPYLSVNVSARQWHDTDFLEQVCRALDGGLAPGTLQLELTESVLMRRTEQIDTLLRALKDRGVRIAVDDFGTGYSSVRYLRDFPIDVLKIDKSFIDDIPADPRQIALVEGIVHLAAALELQVIAEGIEQPAQRELLERVGCRYGQGYLFARPMTVEQSETVLRRQAADRMSPRD
ncbi:MULTISPECIES: EAL domain-containing protein [unclassified Streptomyces]|uniref:EAL domain-containing protein n=1 Tax=unclassified Streptomyces TaxID=2593676 RepID=UPI000BE26536|nr:MULTISPECIES: EAL domain-containing protein [unclassified Streptomyces]